MNAHSLITLSLILLVSVGVVHASQKAAAPAGTVFADLTKSSRDIDYRVVDVFQIMHESDLGKEVSQLLEATNNKYQTELGAMQNQIQQDMANFQAKAATMSEATRERAAKNIKKAQVEFELLAKERQEDFQVLQQKQTEKMFASIREIAKEVGVKTGADVIADKATGQILYSSARVDVGTELVTNMNAQFAATKAKTATAQAKPAESKPATVVANATKDKKEATA